MLNACQPAAALLAPHGSTPPFPGLFCPLQVATAAQWVLTGYSLVRWGSGRCGDLSRTPEYYLVLLWGVSPCAAHDPPRASCHKQAPTMSGGVTEWRCWLDPRVRELKRGLAYVRPTNAKQPPVSGHRLGISLRCPVPEPLYSQLPSGKTHL